MNTTFLTPAVNPSREFLEIASDFSNSLDIVREALSNAFDAKAKEVKIVFDVVNRYGSSKLRIKIEDNGRGMDMDGLQSFFDLGNSLRRDQKYEDSTLIGEKGHGTKIYFNSERVRVTTGKGNKKYVAVMDNPIGKLHEEEMPTVMVTVTDEKYIGTSIELTGYNNNERSIFTHEKLKDYIYWFTKFGSFERELFGSSIYDDVRLILKGVDRDELEELTFGHKFPKESESLDKLLDMHLADAPHFFVKRYQYNGVLKKFPEIRYQALFYVVGNKAKWSVNPMLRRSGYPAPPGAYTVQERYGVWLTKDYIPVQRKNEWIGSRGSEYTKLLAFFNCQALRLTANRGSVENTQAEVLEEIRITIKEIYELITDSEDWHNLEWLEAQSQAYQSERKEEKDLEKRLKFIKNSKTGIYKGVLLREPRQEQGVFAVYHAIDLLEPDLFPFEIVDYDTHAGIDVLARLKNTGVDLERSSLRFVEFKFILKENFNHSFGRLYGIVCWKLSLKDDEVVTDVFEKKRKLKVIPKSDSNPFTRYFLEDETDPHRIEVIVLEEYLQQRLGITFQRVKHQ